MAQTLWDNDLIQFARLIAEMESLGILADHTSIEFVFKVCSFLPALGLVTVFLPNIGGSPRRPKPA